MTDLKNLFLFERHLENGAKFIPFAGWNMPVSYGSALEEHLGVRNKVRLFDVSHMGEIKVSGPDATEFLNYALTNDLNKCSIGQAQYSLLCRDDGGTLDDLLVYRRDENEYLLCVNASNESKDFDSLLEISQRFSCLVENLSEEYGQLALQGPLAESILSDLFGTDFSELPKFKFIEGDWMGGEAIISRTGYTGADGFEIYCPTPELNKWFDAFDDLQVRWAGLAARDSLRLEAGYPLYGHELSPTISPVQAKLTWAVGWAKTDFSGCLALKSEKESSPKGMVLHYVVEDRRIPRQGCQILDPFGNEAGIVLSGGFSPLLSKPIGSALVDTNKIDKIEKVGWKVLLRENQLPIEFGPPALKRSSAKK